MAEYIPEAMTSPMNDRGIIKWLQGDTFDLNLTLELYDQDGEEIVFDNTVDTLTINFYSHKNILVKAFEYGAGKTETITDNVAVLHFDDTVTALFPKGRYHYEGIYKNTGRRITIIDDAPAEVL